MFLSNIFFVPKPKKGIFSNHIPIEREVCKPFKTAKWVGKWFPHLPCLSLSSTERASLLTPLRGLRRCLSLSHKFLAHQFHWPVQPWQSDLKKGKLARNSTDTESRAEKKPFTFENQFLNPRKCLYLQTCFIMFNQPMHQFSSNLSVTFQGKRYTIFMTCANILALFEAKSKDIYPRREHVTFCENGHTSSWFMKLAFSLEITFIIGSSHSPCLSCLWLRTSYF